jgi:hypothetical protein
MSNPNSCGCVWALLRDPFYPPLISHWKANHPEAMAALLEAQSHRTDLSPRPEAAMRRVGLHYTPMGSEEFKAKFYAEHFMTDPAKVAPIRKPLGCLPALARATALLVVCGLIMRASPGLGMVLAVVGLCWIVRLWHHV